MTPKQIYRALDKTIDRAIMHCNALLNHPETTDPELRRTVLDLREGLKRADARLYAVMSETE